MGPYMNYIYWMIHPTNVTDSGLRKGRNREIYDIGQHIAFVVEQGPQGPADRVRSKARFDPSPVGREGPEHCPEVPQGGTQGG